MEYQEIKQMISNCERTEYVLNKEIEEALRELRAVADKITINGKLLQENREEVEYLKSGLLAKEAENICK